MILLVLLGRKRGQPAPLPEEPVAVVESVVPPSSQRPLVRALPEASAPLSGTPSIDLLAILTIRRRIEREGRRTYLDQLLLQNDSVIVRWPQRARPLQVYFTPPDSTLDSLDTGAVAQARSAMASWNGNGIALQETEDSSRADILVRWVAVTPLPEGGSSAVFTDGDRITRAEIVLGVRKSPSEPMDLEERQRSAIHQFGHALGLSHSDDFDDIMYRLVLVSSPSRRDRATLLLLYTVPPGSLKTE